MSHLELGCYVTHAKLSDLGSGEVLGAEDGILRIRFASGQRNFRLEQAAPHLTVVTEAPAKPPAKAARGRAKKAAQ